MKFFAHNNADSVCVEVIELDDSLTPGEDIFTKEFAEGLVPVADASCLGKAWDGKGWGAPPEPPALIVPISAAQARIQLTRMKGADGVDYGSKLDGLSDLSAETTAWLQHGGQWIKSSDYVGEVTLRLKMSDADVEKLFVQGRTVQA